MKAKPIERISLRIDQRLLRRMHQAVAAETLQDGEPRSLSQWIREAIEARLAQADKHAR